MPALTRARTAIASPSTVIAAAEVSGSQRVISRLSPFSIDMKRPAKTIKSPTAIKTAARPILKATMRNNPKPIRCRATALSSTTSAAGHGTMPPVTPTVESTITLDQGDGYPLVAVYHKLTGHLDVDKQDAYGETSLSDGARLDVYNLGNSDAILSQIDTHVCRKRIR